MAQRSFIALAVGLGLLIFGSVGVWAFDAARDDLIADGITAGGIDVGGMRASEARAKLERELGGPLNQPVVVKYGKKRFKLGARRARVRADIEGMVQTALSHSRDGNLVSRAARELTGGKVEEEIPLRASYSRSAVKSIVRRVKRTVDQSPRDASVTYSGYGLSRVKARNGRELKSGTLQRSIEGALIAPSASRTIKAHARVVHPDVRTSELEAKYPLVITVDRGSKQLKLYRRLELVQTYAIAVGAAGYDTPAGQYNIQTKEVNPVWHVPNRAWAGSLAGRSIPPGPQNPLKARWMGIYNGAGIHGTADAGSIGSAASHGCIRMTVPDVIALFGKVDVGTPVFIS
jgi:lipoprotein-anchoring transpeptidase ErfK/SrfK